MLRGSSTNGPIEPVETPTQVASDFQVNWELIESSAGDRPTRSFNRTGPFLVFRRGCGRSGHNPGKGVIFGLAVIRPELGILEAFVNEARGTDRRSCIN
jgi:hypothetical protein